MTEWLVAVVAAATALVGLFVALLAYRGYRRNDSPRMRALAAGVLAIAVVPYVVGEFVTPLASLSDAQTLFAVTLSHALGLWAIYRSFD
jgi:uncharacterized membrane protein